MGMVLACTLPLSTATSEHLENDTNGYKLDPLNAYHHSSSDLGPRC